MSRDKVWRVMLGCLAPARIGLRASLWIGYSKARHRRSEVRRGVVSLELRVSSKIHRERLYGVGTKGSFNQLLKLPGALDGFEGFPDSSWGARRAEETSATPKSVVRGLRVGRRTFRLRE